MKRYTKDRLRRSMMFVPGNNPGMIRDVHIYPADSIMFDLEDSVAYTEKDTARLLVYNALKTLNFGNKEIVVRINDLSSGLGVMDLEAIVPAGVHVVRLPKTDSAQDVIDCEKEIARIERKHGIEVGSTGMMAAIESANGVLNAREIAHASDRLIGIALGAEDYVTDLKTTRADGIELLFARSMILNAARSAGIAALDTVYSDVNNEEGFIAEATLIKKLGFDGKSVINPRQIAPLHKVFMPSEKDLNKAYAIMEAIEDAKKRGSGVASLKGKMIDKPVVLRAQRLIALHEAGLRMDDGED
ncbi:MAG: citrate lyase subunit beta [Oscillospiraceae bacterium]|nr:citrate lyase subunit beta [Oscillospiraceae bacterium]